MRALAIALLTLLVTRAATAASPYVRLGAGFERSDETTQRDRNCGATTPPALFGCGEGIDGHSLAARGDFGRTAAWELAGGLELTRHSRIELSLNRRNDFQLEAEANFRSVAGEQPVTAEARATSALLIGFADIGPFFVSAGAGVSRNELDAVTYAFPGIAPDAATITRGGVHTGFAWTAAAGTSIPLTDGVRLDVALRYSDLGTFRTSDGPATIIRPARTFELEIAGTESEVRTVGITVSLRWRM